MNKILLVQATRLESKNETEIEGVPIELVGIGKISSSSNLTELILKNKPDLIINFGSCGNLKNHSVGQLLEVGQVYNNIDCEPFAPYGCTPYVNLCNIKLSDSGIKCFTTDQFYDVNRVDYTEKYKGMIHKCDLVDMECYSLAQVSTRFNIPLKSYKWISDDGSSDSWEDNASVGYETFKDFFVSTYL